MRLTKSQLALIVIAAIVILSPIIVYIWNFNSNVWEIQPEKWGPFGDFIGGILNPIISLLTLIVTVKIALELRRIEQRNHEESVHNTVKPLFSIRSGYFFSSDISNTGPSTEDYYSYKTPQAPAPPFGLGRKEFYLKIKNKGLGIATDVTVTYEINLEELKQLLPNNQNLMVAVNDIKTGEDGTKFVWINYEYANIKGNSKILAEEKYGLGVIKHGKKIKVIVPPQIMSVFAIYNLKRKLNFHIENFPSIFVTLNYKNIHSKSLSTKFRVGLFHVHDYNNYSVFRLLQANIEN